MKEEGHAVVNSAIIFHMGKYVIRSSNQNLFTKQNITNLSLTGAMDDMRREQQKHVLSDLEMRTHCSYPPWFSTCLT